MKIKMKTTAAGPTGTYLSGWEYDLPEGIAIVFTEGGYAENLEPLKEKRAPKPIPPSVEVATAPGPEERAEVKPKAKAKPKPRRRTRSPKKG